MGEKRHEGRRGKGGPKRHCSDQTDEQSSSVWHKPWAADEAVCSPVVKEQEHGCDQFGPGLGYSLREGDATEH